jgi:hypothetical protein
MTQPPPAPSSHAPPPALVAAVRRILAPMVRVLIHFGVTFPSLSVLLKGVYVEQAERHFRLSGKAMTDSRVTLLTGVHRKDVSRLRGADPDDGPADLPLTLGAQVVGRWLGDPAFRAADGAPRPLPRTAGNDAPSFEGLVSGISRDLRPRAVLDEFLHSGLVRARGDGLLELAKTADLPVHDMDRLAFYFGRNVGDHLEAASHNVLSAVGAGIAAGDPPFLERAVFHDGLTPESVAELRAEAERRAMEALIALNEQAVRLAEADAGRPEATGRFSAGVYVYARPGKDDDADRGTA